MNKKITIELSEAELLRVEKRAQSEGYGSVDAYVDALVREDIDLDLDPEWLNAFLEEGMASGNAGPLTRERIHQMVSEGIARAKANK